MVEQESPLNQSRFNLTISEFQDSLNPRLLTRMIMPNGFSQTMTYNAQGNLATVTESYSNTTMEYRYTEDVDTPPFNPKWRNLLREVHRPAVTVDGSLVTYTLDSSFCVAALERALRFGHPQVFNTDQGCQFTSQAFTGVLIEAGVSIRMDGVGRCIDNIFCERLWRTVKYENVYLNDYDTGEDAFNGLGRYFPFYNHEP